MITKIRIKNFGSIKDEQLIKFNKDVTTFIGKNESGKSTILKAIDKLNGDKILESEKMFYYVIVIRILKELLRLKKMK